MKLMKHPQHGVKHVYSDNEEAHVRRKGWLPAEEVKEPVKEKEPYSEIPTIGAVTPVAPEVPKVKAKLFRKK